VTSITPETRRRDRNRSERLRNGGVLGCSASPVPSHHKAQQCRLISPVPAAEARWGHVWQKHVGTMFAHSASGRIWRAEAAWIKPQG
jgi:hypothetical protein